MGHGSWVAVAALPAQTQMPPQHVVSPPGMGAWGHRCRPGVFLLQQAGSPASAHGHPSRHRSHAEIQENVISPLDVSRVKEDMLHSKHAELKDRLRGINQAYDRLRKVSHQGYGPETGECMASSLHSSIIAVCPMPSVTGSGPPMVGRYLSCSRPRPVKVLGNTAQGCPPSQASCALTWSPA